MAEITREQLVAALISIPQGGIPRLAGLDLGGLKLKGLDLSRANLRGSRLVDCDLEGARLVDADLEEADLSGAVLWGADLSGSRCVLARFVGATLTAAVFNGADLEQADFSGAHLEGTNLTQALNLTPQQIDAADVDDNTYFSEAYQALQRARRKHGHGKRAAANEDGAPSPAGESGDMA